MTFKLSNHRIPFAEDGTGTPRAIGEVERGLACKCFCPSCEAPLVANKGERRLKVWYFSHKANTACAGALESSLHIAVKDLLVKHKRLLLPPCIVYKCPPGRRESLTNLGVQKGEFVHQDYKYTDNTALHDAWLNIGAGKGRYPANPKLVTFDSVSTEQTEGNIRPDIVGLANGRKLFIEVAVSHFIDFEKLSRLRVRGVPTVELIVPLSQGLEWADLERWLLTELHGKYWALNSRAEELADSDGAQRAAAYERRQAAAAKARQDEERREKARAERVKKAREARAAEREAEALQEAQEQAALAEKEAREKAARDEARRKQQEVRARELEAMMAAAARVEEARRDEERKIQERFEAAQRKAEERATMAREALSGNPSPDRDPTGLPVVFLDYDSAIQRGSSKEQERLELLASALRGIPCSIVVTSEIRQSMTASELAALLFPVGGRHVGVTPIIDPDSPYGTRDLEIRQWLDQHHATSICIVDGTKTGLPVKPTWVSTRFGLQPEDVAQMAFTHWRRREHLPAVRELDAADLTF